MYCERCGAELPPGASFCTNCGATVESETYAPDPGYYDAPVIRPSTVLVFGILALSLFWIYGVPGIVLGAIGMHKAKSYVAYYGRTTGQVKAGSIMSKWGFALGIVTAAALTFVGFLALIGEL